ncbi:signal recognition particle-docking protein FtsY [Aminithiophilus ramosus]|uniref:Signal recognition particle receptor FtsY n=2 Tax=Synergistales TaxID=649776 RepID=A0A9Q7A9J5_9BACT|nr:signal recognition particle-docking protein FtsY [Aminithiophilus ramosus]QTX32896.1 signal recognition particle-docking protein FtsY [Aminithiophilus ramosus]QVL37339.1 signal recognition particle-docking protein FtsY [Synergistota bacterium]
MAFWDKLRDGLKGVRNRWSQGIAALFLGGTVSEAFWENLEDLLVSGDVGVELAERLIAELREYAKKGHLSETSQLRDYFLSLLEDRLLSVKGMGEPLALSPRPSLTLLVGVNGSGKTTTAGKLAAQYRRQGHRVLLAAADTYRAAAIDQLKSWGERTGCRVVSQGPGSDAAAVVFDAIQAARSTDADLILADSAGRLHTKHNLMEELRKLRRVIDRELPSEAVEVLLVLDAVMGQNGFRQVEAFHEALGLTGVILAKYDNTAKGGVLLSVVDRLKLPIRYVGLGEGVEDLRLFSPHDFVEELLSNRGD